MQLETTKYSKGIIFYGLCLRVFNLHQIWKSLVGCLLNARCLYCRLYQNLKIIFLYCFYFHKQIPRKSSCTKVTSSGQNVLYIFSIKSGRCSRKILKFLCALIYKVILYLQTINVTCNRIWNYFLFLTDYTDIFYFKIT